MPMPYRVLKRLDSHANALLARYQLGPLDPPTYAGTDGAEPVINAVFMTRLEHMFSQINRLFHIDTNSDARQDGDTLVLLITIHRTMLDAKNEGVVDVTQYEQLSEKLRKSLAQFHIPTPKAGDTVGANVADLLYFEKQALERALDQEKPAPSSAPPIRRNHHGKIPDKPDTAMEEATHLIEEEAHHIFAENVFEIAKRDDTSKPQIDFNGTDGEIRLECRFHPDQKELNRFIFTPEEAKDLDWQKVAGLVKEIQVKTTTLLAEEKASKHFKQAVYDKGNRDDMSKPQTDPSTIDPEIYTVRESKSRPGHTVIECRFHPSQNTPDKFIFTPQEAQTVDWQKVATLLKQAQEDCRNEIARIDQFPAKVSTRKVSFQPVSEDMDLVDSAELTSAVTETATQQPAETQRTTATTSPYGVLPSSAPVSYGALPPDETDETIEDALTEEELDRADKATVKEEKLDRAHDATVKDEARYAAMAHTVEPQSAQRVESPTQPYAVKQATVTDEEKNVLMQDYKSLQPEEKKIFRDLLHKLIDDRAAYVLKHNSPDATYANNDGFINHIISSQNPSKTFGTSDRTQLMKDMQKDVSEDKDAKRGITAEFTRVKDIGTGARRRNHISIRKDLGTILESINPPTDTQSRRASLSDKFNRYSQNPLNPSPPLSPRDLKDAHATIANSNNARADQTTPAPAKPKTPRGSSTG